MQDVWPARSGERMSGCGSSAAGECFGHKNILERRAGNDVDSVNLLRRPQLRQQISYNPRCGYKDHMGISSVVGARELKTRLGHLLQRVRQAKLCS